MMNNNPPLTEAGKQRAEALKEVLKTKKIGYVFSTNTLRTLSTRGTSEELFQPKLTEIYEPVPNESFISHLLSLKKCLDCWTQ